MHLQICLLELLRAKFSEILLGLDTVNLKRGTESHGCSDGLAVWMTLALQAFLSSTDPLSSVLVPGTLTSPSWLCENTFPYRSH